MSPASDIFCARPLKRVWLTLLAPQLAGPRRPGHSLSESSGCSSNVCPESPSLGNGGKASPVGGGGGGVGGLG